MDVSGPQVGNLARLIIPPSLGWIRCDWWHGLGLGATLLGNLGLGWLWLGWVSALVSVAIVGTPRVAVAWVLISILLAIQTHEAHAALTPTAIAIGSDGAEMGPPTLLLKWSGCHRTQ